MLCVGALKGKGRLEVENLPAGKVSYQLIVWQKQNGRKSARGMLDGKADVLLHAFTSGTAKLRLGRDQIISIVLVRFDGRAHAEFQVSGPVPEF